MMTKMIVNYVVAVSSCIDLFHMFLQSIQKFFSPMKGSFTQLKGKKDTIYQKSIDTSGNRFMILQSLKKLTYLKFVFLSSNIHVLLFLFMFALCINDESFSNKLFTRNNSRFKHFYN